MAFIKNKESFELVKSQILSYKTRNNYKFSHNFEGLIFFSTIWVKEDIVQFIGW